ncbi:hypothetical protein GF407_11625 [candidate division KSB1 bacterium]|nr:hypothetical protein [candidate division KSB1 bacterium]
MESRQNRILFWLPRLLTLLFAIFISLFALDVFSKESTFWEAVVGFIIHLIPTFVILLILYLAWRREWVGSVFFALLGIFYIIMTKLGMDILAYIFISGSLFVIALLFLWAWLNKRKIQKQEG